MTEPLRDPRERAQSQLPAVQVLVAAGFQPLSPAEALAMRGGKRSNVVLDTVLEERVLALNNVSRRGREYPLDITDAREAIRKLIDIGNFSDLKKTNQKVYDDLVRGVAISKTIDGVSLSPHIRFVDWDDPTRNVYHVTVEYAVERTGSTALDRLDVVAFVNGIPFLAMECKRPDEPIATADRQLLRYQLPAEIPGFFRFVQLLIAGNGSAARYATVGTPKKFWSTWRHPVVEPDAAAEQSALEATTERPLDAGDATLLFGDVTLDLAALAARTPSEQDATLFALARPERLLELVRTYTVFDGGTRKIARHQQFFAVKRTIETVTSGTPGQRRPGGLIWHTQGSGKSLTMVMLAKALTYDSGIPDPRVLLVTDRDDLDLQIRDTFLSCDLQPVRARSGAHLAELLRDRAALVTTIVNKFENAAKTLQARPLEPDPNVFVLIDEGHRSHSARVGDFGQFAKKMRRSLPLANFIAFTGTPLMTKERNSFLTFGDLIHRYTIKDANDDHAVVPLLYEGRYVGRRIAEGGLDSWFDVVSRDLTPEQRRDLKRRFSTEKALSSAGQVIRAKAFDISEHYRQHWQGTGLKAQLVAPDKASAIRFKDVLDEIGDVSSEVIISAPGNDSDVEAGDRESREIVQRFWTRTMERYGTESAYNRQVIDAFKDAGEPEILIVVSKLLTGFDAPRNTVLYICRSLRDHTLLQAIARVNRLYDPPTPEAPTKEFGVVIDYEGLLRELDQALDKYSALDDFDPSDIAGAISSVREEIDRLDGRWSAVWAIFDGIRREDREALQRHLAPDDVRDEFYARLSEFTRTLHLALSSELVDEMITSERLARYKSDWAWFVSLRGEAQLRYNERVDLRDYEPKIRKLLDDHLTALPPIEHIPPLDLSDPAAVNAAAEDSGLSPAARADRIAHATRRRITERMDEDPAFYERFSRLLQDAIDAHHAHRLEELEYLKHVRQAAEAVSRGRTAEASELPSAVQGNPHAASVYGAINDRFTHARDDGPAPADDVATAAVGLIDIVQSHLVIGIWDENTTARNELETAIDLYLWDVVEAKMGLTLTEEEEVGIRDDVLRIAKARFT
ncbi:type I restriction endonuclease subunit R [Microbacterium sp. BH-3-3-3]|uniref:type I restriction endonuclease subunit R n=1 Tax=Microbacterium sp. BH-3-3-3 TaxID=1906742 RepID=UPI0011A8D432|nr:HsdR family type I site-specific deoxyribonuclease [Microbacterium sp. BH-3-3-3]